MFSQPVVAVVDVVPGAGESERTAPKQSFLNCRLLAPNLLRLRTHSAPDQKRCLPNDPGWAGCCPRDGGTTQGTRKRHRIEIRCRAVDSLSCVGCVESSDDDVDEGAALLRLAGAGGPLLVGGIDGLIGFRTHTLRVTRFLGGSAVCSDRAQRRRNGRQSIDHTSQHRAKTAKSQGFPGRDQRWTPFHGHAYKGCRCPVARRRPAAGEGARPCPTFKTCPIPKSSCTARTG